ncbi:Gfo/Idh/MocA family protein [Alienimonas californiensis]|uniref:Glucose--fructose oxidoreductase n=1 Tax=Alienimonas californiensis TaxID=2527989 RepID=A0A517P8V9_9PLAN|nr:Gfo/Idh/MocA family oxidoreductase [Alienimonas californiensis]QDT15814.1 Glucose--fructose oxidoreductase precursor [Alienimonas californiensis]
MPATRRRFCQAAGGLLAAAAIPSALSAPRRPMSEDAVDLPPAKLTGRPLPDLLQPLPLPPGERIGFALVGLGAYALNQIAPNLANTRGCKLAAVVSGNAEKAGRVAAAYGLGKEHVYSYDDFDRIADDPAVDVVYIILPNAFHREWTERAFAAGKHVLCEKPMAGTPADCEAMIAAGERAGKKLMIGYRAQFDPYNLEAIKAVRGGDGTDGEIGVPRIVVSDHGRILDLAVTRDQWRAKKELACGGSLYDIGIYSVNGARYLLGEEPTETTARYLPRSDRPQVTVEEGVEWQMTFPSGAVASCTSSYRVAGNKRIHVQGAEGEVTLDPATDYYIRNLKIQSGDKTRDVEIPQANQFAAMLDEMATAVRENRDPKTPGAEGLRDVRIMTAIYKAAETGEAVKM